MENQSKLERAKQRLAEEKGFFSHLTMYLLINGFLAIMNTLDGGHGWWYYPAIGWGIGLFFHWLRVFGPSWFPGKRWEERRMKQLLEDDRI